MPSRYQFSALYSSLPRSEESIAPSAFWSRGAGGPSGRSQSSSCSDEPLQAPGFPAAPDVLAHARGDQPVTTVMRPLALGSLFCHSVLPLVFRSPLQALPRSPARGGGVYLAKSLVALWGHSVMGSRGPALCCGLPIFPISTLKQKRSTPGGVLLFLNDMPFLCSQKKRRKAHPGLTGL